MTDQSHAPYGYCPKCGQPGHERERRPNGDDTCVAGHKYPSRDAIRAEDDLEIPAFLRRKPERKI